MKHIILTIILIATLQVCDAQSQAPYRPMHLDVGTTWYMEGWGKCLNFAKSCTRLTSKKDTIINSFTYYKLTSKTGVKDCGPINYGDGFYRNDTLNKKVYRYSGNSQPDQLIHNFDLQIGDTLVDLWPSYDFIVDSIYTVNTGVGPTTRYRAHDATNIYHVDSVTEGFGGVRGYFSFHYGTNFSIMSGEFNSLGVFDSNGNNLFGSGKCIIDTFTPIPDAIDNYSLTQSIHIAPNPVYNNFSISNLYETTSSSLIVLDVLGKQIFKQNNLKNHISIDCSKWNHGVYYLQISQGNAQSFHKILKQ
jgi:hypothetical protein